MPTPRSRTMVPGEDEQPEEGRVLSPEELEIEDDENVSRIDEGRFVVSPDGPPKTEDFLGRAEPDPDPAEPTQEAEQSPPQLTEPVVHDWLREQFAESKARYGFDVTASFDGTVSQQRMASNDIVTVFESLMLWYARHVDDDTPVEEVLGILLMESNVPVRYPAGSIRTLIESTNLGPEDSIGDLLAAVEDEDGLQF